MYKQKYLKYKKKYLNLQNNFGGAEIAKDAPVTPIIKTLIFCHGKVKNLFSQESKEDDQPYLYFHGDNPSEAQVHDFIGQLGITPDSYLTVDTNENVNPDFVSKLETFKFEDTDIKKDNIETIICMNCPSEFGNNIFINKFLMTQLSKLKRVIITNLFNFAVPDPDPDPVPDPDLDPVPDKLKQIIDLFVDQSNGIKKVGDELKALLNEKYKFHNEGKFEITGVSKLKTPKIKAKIPVPGNEYGILARPDYYYGIVLDKIV